MLLYQFITIEDEAGDDFQSMAFSEINTQTLYEWMESYFE